MYKIILALLLISQISVNGQSPYNDEIKKAATSVIQTFDQLQRTTRKRKSYPYYLARKRE